MYTAGAQQPIGWRPIEGLRTTLVSLIALNGAAAIGLIVAHWHRVQIIDDIPDGTVSLDTANMADDYVTVATVVFFLALAVSGLVWIIWQWRVAKNAELLGRRGDNWGPGWSIGGWFIPCASIVIPVLVMQRLWRASDPHAGPHWLSAPPSALVGWWWGAFVISNFLGNADIQFGSNETPSPDSVRTQDRLGIAGMLVWLACAVLAYLVVTHITQRQTELRAVAPNATPAAGFGAVAPGWYADPAGRFETRYWDGTRWTEHVATQGATSTDPPNPTASY